MIVTVEDIFRQIQTPASSMSEARRQVFMDGVRFNGEQVTSMGQEVEVDEGSVFQVGKRSIWHFEGNKWIRLVELQDGVRYLTQLKDSENEQQAPICLKIQRSDNDGLVMIGAEGYGEMTAEEGHGFPVVIEHHNGELRMLVWANINQEDPTDIISLEGAREDARADDGD